MTNKEWTDLIAKEFEVSNSCAKGMLHAMYETKKRLSMSGLSYRERQEKERRKNTKRDAGEMSDRDM